MKCPKCKHPELKDFTLSDSLPVKHCPNCEGNWLPVFEYETWQGNHSKEGVTPELLAIPFESNIPISEYDSKAGLCPECGRYLTRSAVQIKMPFYVDRCPQCSGFWCDKGEWSVLSQLGIHYQLERIFSSEWQSQVREKQQEYYRYQSLKSKLGEALSQDLFQLVQVLKDHPEKDFALAYLIQNLSDFEESKEIQAISQSRQAV